MDICDKETGVTAQVISDNAAPRDKLPLADTGVLPGVHHHLGMLICGEVWVVDVPVGVSSPTEDFDAVVVGVSTRHTNLRGPRLRNTQHIIIHSRGQQRMHGEVAATHVNRQDGAYHH